MPGAGGTDILTYTVLFLMGHKVAVASDFDRAYQKAVRWTCYDSALASALHDQDLSDWQRDLLASHLSANRGLIDKTYSTYFQLLGLYQPEGTTDDLVALANANWPKRRKNRKFDSGDSSDGYGEYNDYYLDIRLSAILRKINWKGESLHRWKW